MKMNILTTTTVRFFRN